jgi:hypothetical protein
MLGLFFWLIVNFQAPEWMVTRVDQPEIGLGADETIDIVG